jgi:hypothetical protein
MHMKTKMVKQKNATVRVVITVPVALRNRMDRACRKQERTMADCIRQLIKDWLRSLKTPTATLVDDDRYPREGAERIAQENE